MIEVTCPACGIKCQFDDDSSGRWVGCPSCGQTISVTESTVAAPPQPTAPPTAPPTTPTTQVTPTGLIKTSGMAITSLVLGILGFCLPLLGIIALVLGISAINRIDNPANRLTGRGMAMAGAIVGGVSGVFFIIMALIGMLLPAFSASRNTARQMTNTTQVRGIQQSMIAYSQVNGNWYPGIDSKGLVVDASVTGRYQLLLNGNYFSGEYIISPVEENTKTPWSPGTTVTQANYSYALLDISVSGGRQKEWQATMNSEATIISDRNTGPDARQNIQSIWTTIPGDWQGSVGWNDNHTSFEYFENVSTKFGQSRNTSDNLFLDETAGDDAWMVD